MDHAHASSFDVVFNRVDFAIVDPGLQSQLFCNAVRVHANWNLDHWHFSSHRKLLSIRIWRLAADIHYSMVCFVESLFGDAFVAVRQDGAETFSSCIIRNISSDLHYKAVSLCLSDDYEPPHFLMKPVTI